jgi:outer membrane receptor protein involved in Fe transport
MGGILSRAVSAERGATLSTDIGPQAVPEALTAFGRQTGLQLIYVSSVVETQQSKGARAGLMASEALQQLLEGTGLGFEFLNARTVKIFPVPTVVPTHSPSSPAPRRSADGHSSSHTAGLEEVLVTGARGREPVSRVPIDIKVWTADAMKLAGIKGMAQLGALTPGVGFAFSGIGAGFYTSLDIRGVTNRWGATVGLYVDDSPIPPSRAATYLLSFPLTFDLDRVEILRGPQTVLLGDHTQAGAIRFSPNQPSLTLSTGLFRLEWGTTEYGSPSYEAGAAVGGPLISNVLGFRVSGWFRQDGGYVDQVDPTTHVLLDANSNSNLNKVVRGAVTLAPSADVQITPSLMYQSIRINGSSSFDPAISDPGQGIFRNPIPVPETAEDTYYLASLKLTAHLQAANLSAVASYFDQTGAATVFLNDNVDNFGLNQHVYTAEVRLSCPDADASLSWIAGIFASREHAHNPVWRAGVFQNDTITEQNELAAFGQIAMKATKSLTASAGVRIGHSKYEYYDYYLPASGGVSDTWAAPRFGLSWQVDENSLLYLTIANGYGTGGVYPLDPSKPHPPDTLWSSEIGSKHNFFGGRLRLETNVFHIQWNNGPPDYNLSTNVEHYGLPGKAVSNGFDLTTQAWLTEHTKASLEVAYTDAHVTQTYSLEPPYFYVHAGDSLPVSPWNVTASLEWDVPLRNSLTASLRVENAFRSAPRTEYFNNPDSKYYDPGLTADPSTNVLNVRAGVRWPSFEVAAFLSNALDAHPTLTGSANGVDNFGGVYTLVPRTFSLSGTWRF